MEGHIDRTGPDIARSGAEGGFALAVAIFAIVVVGVLVTGGFFVAQQESRIGMATENSSLAFLTAEHAIADVAHQLEASELSSLGIWADTTLALTLGEGTADVTVTRTGGRTFFVDATSSVTGRGRYSGASRRLGMIAKLFTAAIDPPAALATTGNLRIGGNTNINGGDSIPTGWDSYCDPNDTTSKPGVVIDEVDSVTYSGNSYEIEGDPRLDEDATLEPDSLLTFGDLYWDDLVALHDVYLDSPELSAGNNIQPQSDSALVNGSYVCDAFLGNEANWGDPINPDGVCGNYFPIIYADSAHSTPLKLQGNNFGQGILLVGHDLQVSGGFTFYGVVIVRGTFSTSGTGGHVQGGVIAANANFDQSTVIGDAVIQYSTCGVDRAILGNSSLARMVPVAERSWVDLSNITN